MEQRGCGGCDGASCGGVEQRDVEASCGCGSVERHGTEARRHLRATGVQGL